MLSWRRALSGDLFDPTLQLSAEERKIAQDKMDEHAGTMPSLWFTLVFFLALIYPVIIVGGRFADAFIRGWGLSKPWSSLIGYLGLTAIHTVAMLVALSIVYTRPRRRALRDCGYEICVRCGYWLRGLGEDQTRCPECGATREPMPAAPVEDDPPPEREPPPTG